MVYSDSSCKFLHFCINYFLMNFISFYIADDNIVSESEELSYKYTGRTKFIANENNSRTQWGLETLFLVKNWTVYNFFLSSNWYRFVWNYQKLFTCIMKVKAQKIITVLVSILTWIVASTINWNLLDVRWARFYIR